MFYSVQNEARCPDGTPCEPFAVRMPEGQYQYKKSCEVGEMFGTGVPGPEDPGNPGPAPADDPCTVRKSHFYTSYYIAHM